ncbi:DUF4439 domain-containing protein [Solihabitans fulvus]|uniref:DUF4439 domain-containing protein n=1 Tax=Solihabitans fulvus TaxID=1892852 RepID=A0A5B2X5S6_9PSEU|nr:ferritin-like domain-containing protein [Solihabitans fulvus]KAA2258594.1 DUF4439 domain-containing protein [Solihabitans fulvus]
MPTSTPNSGAPVSPSQGRQLAPEVIDAVQQALSAEHAAVWTCSLATAFLQQDNLAAANDGATAHRARRDATERLLRDVGATPRPAEPAYLPPDGQKPVSDAASAIAMLAAAETDGAHAWHGVLERTDDGDLRRTALDALTNCAVRAARWRRTGGIAPFAVPLPGRS